jgi:hypothetical protein
MNSAEHPLKKIIELTRDQWDRPTVRDAVRDNLRKVCLCQTPALGAEVYASAAGEKMFYHTCKSSSCPRCGFRATLLWQQDRESALPEIPFVGITLTMPDVFWPVFKAFRHLQHDLPALGASVIKRWAWSQHQVRLHVIVVPHSFGGHLNYNPHLHLMVSAGGLKAREARWERSVEFDREEIMELWRHAVTWYLLTASRRGLLGETYPQKHFKDLILTQVRRRWNIHISKQIPKKHFMAYAGRYIRRLPIAQKRILKVTDEEVVYLAKDTRSKSLQEKRSTPSDFVFLLSQHVRDRYQHSMRYFGLLAPRTQHLTKNSVFFALDQKTPPKAKRLPWSLALKKYFGVDPLLDLSGNKMRWVGRIKPL